MKIKLFSIALACMLLMSSAPAETPPQDGVILHLSFDEGQGSVVYDESGHLQAADVQYQYLTPAYTDPMDPQWRRTGVEGGSLLFDGCSTYISYPQEEICVSGSALSVSVWVAPRAFEWDDPNGEFSGNAHLTAIAGQYYKDADQGFLLGYQRFGRLCFEVGVGDDWFTLWADDERLVRNEWNHVAAVFDGAEGRFPTLPENLGNRAADAGDDLGVQVHETGPETLCERPAGAALAAAHESGEGNRHFSERLPDKDTRNSPKNPYLVKLNFMYYVTEQSHADR